MTGCEKEDFSYKGPLFVEFSAIRVLGTTNSFQFYNSRFYYHNRNVAPDLGTDSIQVQLIGPHQSKNVRVNYKVYDEVYYDIFEGRLFASQPEGVEDVDWYKITSKATAGVHYEMPEEGTIEIPAGKIFGYIEVNVLVNNINTNTASSPMVFVGLVDSEDTRANIPSSLFMHCFAKRNTASPTIF
jgi:hypothetical protein